MVRLDGRLAQRLERPAYTYIFPTTPGKPQQITVTKSAKPPQKSKPGITLFSPFCPGFYHSSITIRFHLTSWRPALQFSSMRLSQAGEFLRLAAH